MAHFTREGRSRTPASSGTRAPGRTPDEVLLEFLDRGLEVLGEPRREAFEHAVQGYVDFYLHHMAVEESQILPAAQRALDPADWAVIDLAFAQYKLSKPEESVSTLTRFIKTYPTNPQIDYAYYLKALVNFDRENRWLAKIARLDVSARDLGAATQSYNDFNEVIRRFPTSQYAEEARQRMIYLRNRLALHDLNVGLYYYQREAYVSAAGRAKYIVETYPQSAYDADAVALLAASYAKLGQDALAADAKRVLESNYPEHPYLGKGWPERRSRWSQLNPFAGEVRR